MIYRNYSTEESREFWMSVDKDLGLDVDPNNYRPEVKKEIRKREEHSPLRESGDEQ